MCLENNGILAQKRNQGYNGMGNMATNRGIFGTGIIKQNTPKVMGMGDLAANRGFSFLKQNPKQTVKAQVAQQPTPAPAAPAQAEQPAPATPQPQDETSLNVGTPVTSGVADAYLQAARAFYFNPKQRTSATRVVA